MVDYLKARTYVGNPIEFIKKAGVDSTSELNLETGVVFYPIKACISNMKIKVYENGRTYIYGSIHKFMNQGKYNYDDFSFSMIESTLHEIFDRFGLPLHQYYIENLELGVNLCPPIKTNSVLNGLLFHGRTFFNYAAVQGKYLQSEKSEKILKAYNKALHQQQSGEIFRWELKFLRMRLLKNTYHIESIADLLELQKLKSASTLIIKDWEDVVFSDPTLHLENLSNKELNKWRLWSNPLWWNQLEADTATKDINKFSREVKAFKALTKLHSDNLQDTITALIREKINYLLDH